jgi:alkylated DNA repair dioxygenase AlkB
MTKPDFRFPTQKAREELSKELGLFYHPGMQDWEWEIANPNEIGKYISHYQLIDDEDKKFVLMEIIIQATTNLEQDFDNYWNTVRNLLKQNFQVHKYSIYYWSLFENDSTDCWQITPFMRTLWLEVNNDQQLEKMEGITYIEKFIDNPKDLFDFLHNNVEWDERMTARKTASFGVAYNYSQISYPYRQMLFELDEICNKINSIIGFTPNNCLINYYLDGRSKMGFHSDQIDTLANGTGVAIVSIGETRTLRFRKIENKDEIIDLDLPSGSLIYMTQEVQKIWQHAIPTTNTDKGRMSLTLRKIII